MANFGIILLQKPVNYFGFGSCFVSLLKNLFTRGGFLAQYIKLNQC
jgi:hypothetical protein